MARVLQITPKPFIIIVNEKQKKTQIPNSLKYYFVISQVLLSYDYGFITVLKKGLRAPVKRFVLLETCFYLLILISPIPFYYDEFSAWGPLFEYVFNVWVLRSTKYKPYDFIVDINKHIRIKYVDQKFFRLTSLINIVIVHGTKIFITIALRFINSGSNLTQHFYTKFNWGYYIAYGIPCLGIDTIAVCQTVLFYYAYACIRNLQDRLKSSEVDINRVARLFVNLADIYDKIRPLQNKLVSTDCNALEMELFLRI